MHGGAVDCDSDEDSGNTFSFTVPFTVSSQAFMKSRSKERGYATTTSIRGSRENSEDTKEKEKDRRKGHGRPKSGDPDTVDQTDIEMVEWNHMRDAVVSSLSDDDEVSYADETFNDDDKTVHFKNRVVLKEPPKLPSLNPPEDMMYLSKIWGDEGDSIVFDEDNNLVLRPSNPLISINDKEHETDEKEVESVDREMNGDKKITCIERKRSPREDTVRMSLMETPDSENRRIVG
mmetsp:Transcript_4072/g.4165  ORF Transcript_4072/g.4165 Transcript_4072/m.4165 type:complete len:233 (-) Transcript_4072:26-724(-)